VVRVIVSSEIAKRPTAKRRAATLVRHSARGRQIQTTAAYSAGDATSQPLVAASEQETDQREEPQRLPQPLRQRVERALGARGRARQRDQQEHQHEIDARQRRRRHCRQRRAIPHLRHRERPAGEQDETDRAQGEDHTGARGRGRARGFGSRQDCSPIDDRAGAGFFGTAIIGTLPLRQMIARRHSPLSGGFRGDGRGEDTTDCAADAKTPRRQTRAGRR